MAENTPRLLLLEFLCHRDDRSETSMSYPFLKGVARDCGVPSLWLFFVGTARYSWDHPEGRTLRADISKEDIAVLRDRIERFHPTHVISNEIVGPALRAVIEAAGISEFLVLPFESDLVAVGRGLHQAEMAPHLSRVSCYLEDWNYIYKPAWFVDWLGAGAHPKEGGHLLDATQPDYEAEEVNTSADFKPGFPVVLAGGRSCRGRPSIVGNPRFAHLEHLDRLSTGCSFCCGSDEGHTLRHRQSPLALVESQLRQIQSAAPSRGRDVYMVNDLGLFMRIDLFFEMVLKNGFRPAKFVFCPRIDDVLLARRRVEAILPRVAAGGHRIGFDVMGIENFNPETMELYNKNISVAQADELSGLMDRWYQDWPGVFSRFHGGKNWLMLLFTPWTTISELRVNYDEAARRGFDSDQFWICTSLLLRRGTPMATLAEQEGGIIVSDFEDRGLLFFPICCMSPLWESIPWRFKDARVADFFRIIIRIFVALERSEARPLFGGDAEFDLFANIYCDVDGQAGGALRRPPWALLAVARKLLDLIEAASAPWSREALLRESVALVKAETAAPKERAEDPPSHFPQSPLGPSEPGRADEAAPAALPPLEREAIDSVAVLLRERRTSALGRLTIESSGRDPRGSPTISLKLLLDGRGLVVDLRDLGQPGPSFFTSRLFKVSYRNESLTWTPDEDTARRLRLLVSLIERRIDLVGQKQS